MNFLHKRLQRAASPAGFERLSARVLPWLAPLAWALLALGTVWGLVFAPMDYQQKNSFRIIYIHVPAAMLSMSIYAMLAVASLLFFVWRSRIAAFFARAAAPYGALMTAVALADRLSAILAIVGVINIPVIHYSVLWWNSLHQGATLFRAGGPSIDGAMLWPLLVMLAAFYALFAVYILRGIGNLILEARIRRQLEGS